MRGGQGMDLAWALTIVGICVVIALFIYALFGSTDASSPSTTNNNYYYPYVSAGRPPGAVRYSERFYGGDACDGKTFKLMFFYMEQCPHCVQFRPEWSKFMSRASSLNNVCAVEVSAKESDTCKQYSIEGFPTIVLEDTRSRKKVVYDGPRTSDAIIAFISQKAV